MIGQPRITKPLMIGSNMKDRHGDELNIKSLNEFGGSRGNAG